MEKLDWEVADTILNGENLTVSAKNDLLHYD
jgi:hypothetical protein